MRVLLLTQLAIYPADAGPKIKTLQVLHALAIHHSVFYCTFVRSTNEEQHIQALTPYCQRIITVPLQRSLFKDVIFFIKSLYRKESFLLLRDDHTLMHTFIQQVLMEENIEAIHVDQLNMLHFVPEEWKGKIILDEHNAVWQVVARLSQQARNPLIRWLLRRETKLLRSFEGQACRRATTVLAVSEQDRRALCEVAGDEISIEVVPITIDCEQFATLRRQRQPGASRLLTIGTLFWPPNSQGIYWWLSTGYRLLQQYCPDVCYDIVGARPPRSLQRLARRFSRVTVHGYVLDTAPFWKYTTALVVPLLSGGGIRVKILEAMALGVPIITTSIGCEGLAVEHGKHVLIADTAEDFAEACARVLTDEDLAQRLSQNAYRLVSEYYDMQILSTAVFTIYGRRGSQKI